MPELEFPLVNVFSNSDWNNQPKTWNSFTTAVEELVNTSGGYALIVHNYTFPQLEWTFTVSDSDEASINFTPNSSNELPTVYVKNGQTITGTVSISGTIINVSGISVSGISVSGSLPSDVINVQNNVVKNHTLTYQFVASSDGTTISNIAKTENISVVMENLCKVEYEKFILNYIVDTKPPAPIEIRVNLSGSDHQFLDTHWIKDWTKETDALQWVLEFDEPLSNVSGNVSNIKFNLSNSNDTINMSGSLVSYSENSETSSTLTIQLVKTSETMSTFENVYKLTEKSHANSTSGVTVSGRGSISGTYTIHTGEELSCEINTLKDRAGNTHDVNSVSGVNKCVLFVKSSTPKVFQYNISVSGADPNKPWEKMFVKSEDTLQIEVFFDCEVNVSGITFNISGSAPTIDNRFNGDDFMCIWSSQVSNESTSNFNVQDGIDLTLSNIKDRAGNVSGASISKTNSLDLGNSSNWTTFVQEVTEISNSGSYVNASGMSGFTPVIHNYSFDNNISEWSCSVHDSDYHPLSTNTTFYIQNGQKISVSGSVSGTIINVSGCTISGVESWELNDSIQLNNNIVNSHSLEYEYSISGTHGTSGTIEMTLTNLCGESSDSLHILHYIIDTQPPNPSGVEFKLNPNSENVSKEHNDWINLSGDQLKWTLTFNEPLLTTNNIDAKYNIALTGSSVSGSFTPNYTDNNDDFKLELSLSPETFGNEIQIYKDITRTSSISGVNVSGVIQTGCELTIQVNNIRDRAGNRCNYYSSDGWTGVSSSGVSGFETNVWGTSPLFSLFVKTTIPQINKYNITVLNSSSTNYWEQVYITTGTELEIEVIFDCEVDLTKLEWRLPDGTHQTNILTNPISYFVFRNDFKAHLEDTNNSKYSFIGIWKYTVQDNDGNIDFTLSNIEDRAGNIGEKTIPPSIFDLVQYSISGTSPLIVYGKVDDIISLHIRTTESVQKPVVILAGTTIPDSDISGSGVSGSPPTSTEWNVIYTIPEPVDNIPPQGLASIYIRTIDSNGNVNVRWTATNTLHIDTIAAQLDSLTIESDAILPGTTTAVPSYAKLGSTITLTIDSNEGIQQPIVILAGTNISGSNISGSNVSGSPPTSKKWTSQYLVDANTPQGPISFTLRYKDSANNEGIYNDGNLASGANVIIDTISPTVEYYAQMSDGTYTLKLNEDLPIQGPITKSNLTFTQLGSVTLLERQTFNISGSNAHQVMPMEHLVYDKAGNYNDTGENWPTTTTTIKTSLKHWDSNSSAENIFKNGAVIVDTQEKINQKYIVNGDVSFEENCYFEYQNINSTLTILDGSPVPQFTFS